MDSLFRQLRTRSPYVGQEDKEGSSRESTIPLQKTQSFKGEKKRTPSWIKRQFSGSMGQDSDSIAEGEYQLAVAAAAFAVKSLEESKGRDARKGSRLPEKETVRKTEETTAPPPPPPLPPPPAERRTKSIKFSDDVPKPSLGIPDQRVHITTGATEKMPETAAVIPPAPPVKKKLSFADSNLNTTSSFLPQGTLPDEKPIRPSIKKTSTFDKTVDRTRSRKSEASEQKREVPSPVRPPFLPADIVSQSTKAPVKGDIDADTWEKNELASIHERYAKLKTKILDWEQKKKTKAKRRLERTEAELDKRRAKAMQHYKSELASIESTAGGARSQAEENRKNEEFKTKEKANKIRLTGKLPTTCWWF
ncbi:OLC1v1032659C1 [Oldenlandia corymbosa var. corymbosa]|uniref:OLC1v1032659C1 n=1 Tax=Oldenlandia corymbosa var. corymbosa TaxID=529605 RepID=A0AAV1CPI2_OLDCO|nr:OLC1v1032659C1 [Oldenlandia corymbosa var. corymbosa]